MKKILLSMAICLLSATIILGQCQLKGQITNDQSEFLAGATILLKEQPFFTDEQGHFVIPNLPPDNYSLQVTYIGFETKIIPIIIKNGEKEKNISVKLQETAIVLDHLVVKASRADVKTPMTYHNLNKTAIEKNNLGQDMPYLLRRTPSAVVTSDGGTGIGYTGIRIRGTDPSRINVTINGIPLNDGESQAVFWVDLPDLSSSTESIQIQRGVGTSVNGTGAFGASINLNTNIVRKEPYAMLSGTIGSFNTQKGNVAFGSGLLNEKFTVDGRYSRITTDGYIDRAEVDLESYFFSGAYVGKKNLLRLNLFSGKEVTYQAWNGVPAQYVDDDNLRTYNSAGTEKTGVAHDNEVDDYKQTHLQALFNQRITKNWTLNLAAHYTKGKGFFEQYKTNEAFSDYGLDAIQIDSTNIIEETDLIRRRWLDNDFLGTTWSITYSSNNNRLEWVFGGAWNRYKGDHFGEIIWAQFAGNNAIGTRYYKGTGDKKDINFYSKLQYNLSNWTGYLDVQYRNIDYRITGTDNDLRDISQSDNLSFLNPKLGVSYGLNSEDQIYASIAVANREPSRNDYTDAPNNIKPQHETLYNGEIGYRKTSDKSYLGINAYYMLYDNQLVLTGQINDVGDAIRVNVDKSYRTGIELEGNVQVLPKLILSGNITFSQNKIKSFAEYRDNWDTGTQTIIEHGQTDLAFSPDIIASTEVAYSVLKDEKHDLEIALLGKYVSEQFIDNTSNENTTLDAYFLTDFRLKYALRQHFFEKIEITLLVRNLLDKEYSSNAWTYRYDSAGYDGRADDAYTQYEAGNTYNLTGYYPQAGRNYLLGLSISF